MSFITNNKSKAFILYLFGFFLFSASPVFADEFEDGLQACKEIQWKGNKRRKSHCFRDLAIATYNAGVEQTDPVRSFILNADQYCRFDNREMVREANDLKIGYFNKLITN